jgi:hypothetical protein
MVSVGLLGKTYYLSTGTRSTWGAVSNGIHSGSAPASLSEISAIRNVTLNLSIAEGDGSSRASLWKLVVMALGEADIDIELPWNPTDTGFQQFAKAFFGRTPMALAILDGDKATAGSQGFWADFVVTSFDREENIDKEMMLKVKVKPTPSAVAPEWVQAA